MRTDEMMKRLMPPPTHHWIKLLGAKEQLSIQCISPSVYASGKLLKPVPKQIVKGYDLHLTFTFGPQPDRPHVWQSIFGEYGPDEYDPPIIETTLSYVAGGPETGRILLGTPIEFLANDTTAYRRLAQPFDLFPPLNGQRDGCVLVPVDHQVGVSQAAITAEAIRRGDARLIDIEWERIRRSADHHVPPERRYMDTYNVEYDVERDVFRLVLAYVAPPADAAQGALVLVS